MAVATLTFWLGRNKYVHIPPGGRQFFRETFSRDGLRAALQPDSAVLFIFSFFALFDQSHSAWVHQATKMDARCLPAL